MVDPVAKPASLAAASAENAPRASETLEIRQARHRKEARDLHSRITSNKKNATKKTRRRVNAECDELEKALKERHAREIAALDGAAAVAVDEDEGEAIPGGGGGGDDDDDDQDDDDDRDEAGVAAEQLRAMDVRGLGAKVPQYPTPPLPPQPAPPPEPQEPPNGPAPQKAGAVAGSKKLSRQKARLARRAAALEAAARAAEEEAARQTDHRGIERGAMRAAFARHGRVEHEIRPDGHCLFAAVADQLVGQLGIPLDDDDDDDSRGDPAEGGQGPKAEEEPGYRTVRRRAAEYVREHGAEYAGFLEEGVESYVRKIRDTAEWGGQIELAAVANVYGVEVWVVQDRATEVVRPAAGAVEGDSRRVWLAYYRHGYGLGEHYNSLRKKP